MDDPLPAVITCCCLVGLASLLPLMSVLRRLYWSDWVQDFVMRWTGESRLVMTAWGPSIAPRRPRVRCTRGALAGGHRTGMCRSLVRVSAPAAPSLPGDGAAGSTVRPDVPPSLMAHPSVGADTSVDPRATRADAALPGAAVGQGGPQLTAAAQGPRHRAAAVSHQAGTS